MLLLTVAIALSPSVVLEVVMAKQFLLLMSSGMVLKAMVLVTLISTVVSLVALVVTTVDTVAVGPPKLTPSFQLAALYFIVN